LIPQAVGAVVIEEVIVTAQKREESVQNVPISITALSGDSLGKLSTRYLSDIGRFTAGVEMSTNKALQPVYNIRGIDTDDFTVGSDPAVAIYVDGVYAARGGGAEVAFADLKRVEVLKGPQGTLYGRNATGGAIHLISNAPVFEQEGKLQFTLGNEGRQDVELVYNQPLSDTFAVRLVGVSRNRDGVLHNLAGGDLNEENQDAFRLSARWQPTQDTDAVLRIDYSEMDQHSAAIYTQIPAVFESANPGQPFDMFGDVSHDLRNIEKRDMLGVVLQVDHQLDDMTLTSITGWREFETELTEDVDGSNNPDYYFGTSNPDNNDYFSQELRLTGESGELKWTLGAGYTEESVDRTTGALFNVSAFESFATFSALTSGQLDAFLPFLGVNPAHIPNLTESELAGYVPVIRGLNRAGTNPGVPGCNFGISCDGIFISSLVDVLIQGSGAPSPGVTTILGALQPRIAGYEPWNEFVESSGAYQSWAIYGDATYAVTDRLNVTAGMRYTYDEKTFDLFTQYRNFLLPGLPIGLAFFNSGQFMLDESQSEEWDAISGRLVFDYHFQDRAMLFASVSTGFKSGGFNSLNFGPEFDTSYDEEEVINFEVGTKGSYLDGTLQLNASLYKYEYDNLQELDLVGKPPVAIIPSYILRNSDAEGHGFEVEFQWYLTDNWYLAGNYGYLETKYTNYTIIEGAGETGADDQSGEPRVDTPENKANLSVGYDFALGGGLTGAARVDYTWIDDRVGSIVDPTKKIAAYELVNVRVDVLSPSESLVFSLWGTNVFDEGVIVEFGSNGERLGSLAGARNLPRLFGVDLTYNF